MTYEKYHSTPQIIETERLKLRRLSVADDEAVYAYGRDPEVTRHVSFPTHQSIEDARTFLRTVLENYAKNEPSVWAICLKETGDLIGTTGLLNWNRDHYRVEIGYALARKYWNQGIVTEAVKGMIDHLFHNTDLIRIEARCKIPNIASARVMEKAGMKFEGILRKQMHFAGVSHDMKMYSIIRDEWEKK
jgi:ribosomal-protein-alanine N-acetyltransferase